MPASVYLAAAPLTHAAGVLCLPIMSLGGRIVIMPKPDLSEFLYLIARFRVTHTFLPPTLIYMLLDNQALDRTDLGSLQCFWYGAAPMSPARLTEALGRIGPVMAQLFGQTEAPMMISMLSPAEHFNADGSIAHGRLSSAGRPSPFTQVSVMDPRGVLLPAGAHGEIVIRGPLVMMGYYKDPQATREAALHGWHHTGDIGYLDAENFLFIVDRARDMIITGGFNVYSVEVEQALLEHPDVQDGAVVGPAGREMGRAGDRGAATPCRPIGDRGGDDRVRETADRQRQGAEKRRDLARAAAFQSRQGAEEGNPGDTARARGGAAMRAVQVAGVGMIPFSKPGDHEPYHVMAASAGRAALADAGIAYERVQQAYAGYVYGDSTSGQKACYELGMTGIPVINVNNNCATGSTALFLARQAVASGAVECAMALGFEQMQPGALGEMYDDRPTPLSDFVQATGDLVGMPDLPLALRCFGGAGLSHMQRYGSTLETFAEIRAKASRHAACNPLALFRKEVTAEQVLQSPMLWPGVMTRLMACPPTCGAACAILVSAEFAARHAIRCGVEIVGQSMTTDFPSTFAARDMIRVVGFDLAREAARRAYEEASIGPEDVDVVELHDCFAQNELISYEALGLCKEGDGARFVADGDNSYGGRYVTNPSGGLLSKGHPLGATGLAQCYELTCQLRGTAEARQVEGARTGLQHNLGLGGACVVTIYQRSS